MWKLPLASVMTFTVLVFSMPAVSQAALNNLNGLSAGSQFLATTTGATTTMHMRITTVGSDTHRFQWDGTPWLIGQGGTGATTFATGSIPFINNGVFSESNLSLFWDTLTDALNIGGTTTPAARLGVRGSVGSALLHLVSSLGSSLFYVAEDGKVGVATTTPSEKLEVVGNIKASGFLQSATLTVSGASSVGSLGIGNASPAHPLDVSGALYSRRVTLTDAATVAVDWDNGNVQSVVLGGNRTITLSDGRDGGIYKLILKEDATGGRTVTWPGTVKWAGGSPPTLTASANAIDIVDLTYDGTDYLASASLAFSAGAAAVTATETFDSYSNGNVNGLNGGSGWSGAWSESTAGKYTIQGTTTFAGSKGVAYDNSAATEDAMTRSFSGQSVGTVVVHARKTTNADDRNSIFLYEGSTPAARVNFRETGNIVATNDAGEDTLQGYSADQWYTVNIQFSNSTDQYRVKIDSGSWSGWKTYISAYNATNLNKIGIQKDNSGNNGSFYVDDIVIYDQ